MNAFVSTRESMNAFDLIDFPSLIEVRLLIMDDVSVFAALLELRTREEKRENLDGLISPARGVSVDGCIDRTRANGDVISSTLS